MSFTPRRPVPRKSETAPRQGGRPAIRCFRWILTLGSVLATPVAAQVPEIISYQGVLTDNTVVLVPDGAYDITFRIFNVSGGPDLPLWTVTQLGVPVTLGGFSVLLDVSTLVPPAGRNP